MLGLTTPALARLRVQLLERHAAWRPTITRLIDPSGHPIGGRWQRWINEAQVPTYPGTMILDASTRTAYRVCATGGCSAPPAPCFWSSCGQGYPETWLLTDDTRDGLYYEQGHIVDFMLTTDADRARFMRIWRLPGTVADWWKDEYLFTASHVHPPGEVWSAAYELCAVGAGDLGSIEDAQGRLGMGRWAIRAQRQSCALFRSL